MLKSVSAEAIQCLRWLQTASSAEVDLNCGCPQGIARRGHYGAWLLEEPDLISSVVPLPVPINSLGPRELDGYQFGVRYRLWL